MQWSSTDFSSFSGSQNKKQAALCGLWQVERIFCLSGKQNLCSSLTQYLGAYCYSSTTSLRAFQSIQMSLLWHENLKTEKRENKELKPRSVQSNMGSLMKRKWISCLDGLILWRISPGRSNYICVIVVQARTEYLIKTPWFCLPELIIHSSKLPSALK